MSCISFKINGEKYTVDPRDICVTTSLNTFIRTHAQLTGTKFMCNEGGCGACIVMVKKRHPVTNVVETFSVNSCLMPVYACHNDDITTIEGLGDCKKGYQREQHLLLKCNGSQCGYCSPGMIMSMHSLLESNDGKVTMQEVENSFGGNICRCTGYRPILDAFKQMATDAPKALCYDIEEIPNMETNCSQVCNKVMGETFCLKFDDGTTWQKPYTIGQVTSILKEAKGTVMLLGGNTARGVYPVCCDIPDVFIDINDVCDLRGSSIINDELVIGATTNFTEAKKIFESVSQTDGFEYCSSLARHVDQIANVSVRNIGTIGGNLSIKHQHNEFPSDLFIILEAVGAKLTIIDANTSTTSTVGVADFLQVDMCKKLIVNVKLPTLDKRFYKFGSYKISIRAQNAHAYVNAAFLLEFKSDVVRSARLCFGGINPEFVHARDTERFLKGKNLYANQTLQTGIDIMENEIRPNENIEDASPAYRKQLAVSLFYKFVLKTCDINLITPKHRSGRDLLERPISSGKLTFDQRDEKNPLNQSVVKVEGMAQISGTAKYANDVPHCKDELWAAFVRVEKCDCKFGSMDPAEALKIKGVRYVFGHKNIPGINSFVPFDAVAPLFGIYAREKLFLESEDQIQYFGQPCGMVLADSFETANCAAAKVKINYIDDDSYMAKARSFLSPWIGESTVSPTIRDVFESKGKPLQTAQTTASQVIGATKRITGGVVMGGQYHFHMEPQTTVCIPDECGMVVHSSTQWPDLVQYGIALLLNVLKNSIIVDVKRVGGGFGAKISRANQVACAAALGTHLTRKLVRFPLDIQSNMTIAGKRNGMIGAYEANVDDNGKIVFAKGHTAHDMGCSSNESPRILYDIAPTSCYDGKLWKFTNEEVITDAASNTWMRAPGTNEAVAMAEFMMEQIARCTGKDPLAVRIANLPAESKLRVMIPQLVSSSQFNERKQQIIEFNKKNRWIKKGIAISIMGFPMVYFNTTTVYVTIYHGDGTCFIKHSGVEIGQGINTKVCQIAAHTLGIPVSFIRCGSTDSVTGANAAVTGGSITSEIVCFTVKNACIELKQRLQPLYADHPNATWTELVKYAYAATIGLNVVETTSAGDLAMYDVVGACCSEIMLDCLTGSIQVCRVDILQEVGLSLNPLTDRGQVEGAFLMGLGYWLNEKLIYDRCGKLVTNRTWNYKPPGAKDIPVDFRINFIQKYSNNENIGSKAVGEPSLTLAISVIFALRFALDSARRDAGLTDDCWFDLSQPATPEEAAMKAGHSTDAYKL